MCLCARERGSRWVKWHQSGAESGHLPSCGQGAATCAPDAINCALTAMIRRISRGRPGFDDQQLSRVFAQISSASAHVRRHRSRRSYSSPPQGRPPPLPPAPRALRHDGSRVRAAVCFRRRDQRQCPQGAVGVQRVKLCSEENVSAAAQVAVPGPAPTSSRVLGENPGATSHSAFRLAVPRRKLQASAPAHKPAHRLRADRGRATAAR